MRRDRMPGQFLVHAAEDGLRVGGAAELDGQQRAAPESAFDGLRQLARRRAGRR